jgi:hypothetical protein
MIEIVKVTNGTGVLSKEEMSELFSKLSSKTIHPQEVEFVLPNSKEKLDVGLTSDQDFNNFRHVMF